MNYQYLENRINKVEKLFEKHFPDISDNLKDSLIDLKIRFDNGDSKYYHNINHIVALILCINKFCNKKYKSDNKFKLLLISALYHDFYHSFGLKNDIINISKSILELEKEYWFQDNFNKEEKDFMINCIFCTVFPFRVEPKNYYEKLIRDCDILTSLLPDNETFAIGLTNEFKNAKINIECSVESMNKFLSEQKIYTKKIKKIFDSLIIINI